MNTRDYACADAQAVLDFLQVKQSYGLSEHELSSRYQQYGKNILKHNQYNALAILVRQLCSPFFYLLGVAAVVLFSLGEISNSVLIAIFVLINILFGFYQEYHAEKTVADLSKIIALKTTVLRAGVVQEVSAIDLVPGDIVMLEPGDVLAADLRILNAQGLLIDESVLTGESQANKKTVEASSASTTQTYSSLGYAGTVVATGTGVGVVVATGKKSSLGMLAEQAGNMKRESLFAQNIKVFTLLMMALIAITLTVIIVLHTWVRPTGLPILELLIFAIALAVSILPEGLPAVMTFCLSQGAARLAAQRVVVKRLSAIEDLGGITTLCADKTGTLTENSLTVAAVYGQSDAVLSASIAVNEDVLLERKDAARSFDDALVKHFNGTIPSGKRVIYLPFDHEHYCAHAIVQHQDTAMAYIRGIPDTIIDRCNPCDEVAICAWVHDQGIQGRRVIAVAQKAFSGRMSSEAIVTEKEFIFVGMVSFEDPIKPSAIQAIKKAQALGLSIKIITGDTAEVAGSVARRIGLIKDASEVVTATMLNEASHEQKLTMYRDNAVFASMSPHQKYTMIKRLESVEQVGFLGEGINDAPALKIAHVALVVDNGTDVAKDAADFILLDRSLEVIVDGIAEGRRIVANTIKYIQLMLICNTSNFYSIAIASLLIDYLPMMPLQILLVNVLSDFPLVAIATDHVALEDVAAPQQYHFSTILTKALVFGVIGSICDFVIFGRYYLEPKMLQTVWFMFSICSELIMFYVIRTKGFFLNGHRPPAVLLMLSITSAIITCVLPLTPIGQTVFGFVAPSWSEYVFFGMLLAIWPLAMELVKICYRSMQNWFAKTAVKECE
jgi:Mg2+-importing ATPase